MGWLNTALGIVGIGLDVYGQKRTADAQAGAYETNAARKEKEAEFQEYRTGVRLDELKEYKDAVIAKQRVAMAANGIVIDQNTAMRVIEDTARKYDKDVAAIKMEGQFNVERARLGAASALEGASQVKASSRINIGSTLLNAANDFDFFG
jgi:hypothetical protein